MISANRYKDERDVTSAAADAKTTGGSGAKRNRLYIYMYRRCMSCPVGEGKRMGLLAECDEALRQRVCESVCVCVCEPQTLLENSLHVGL